MLKLSVPSSAKTAHAATYLTAVRRALELLAGQQEVVIGYKHCTVAVHNPDVANYFAIHRSYNVSEERTILTGDQSMLADLIRDERSYARGKGWNENTPPYRDCLTVLKHLFDYGRFKDGKGLMINKSGRIGYCKMATLPDGRTWGPYAYIDLLGLRYCPYCNAETVYSIKSLQPGLSVRSDLDHYYAQSRYPYLAISLANIVPSCTRCNRDIKRTRELDPSVHASPFEISVHENVKFSYDFLGDDIRIAFDYDERSLDAKRSMALLDFFSVADVYNQLFKQEARDILNRKRIYQSSYRQELRNYMCDLTDAEFNRALLGTALDDEDIDNVRLGKMLTDFLCDD